MKMYERTIGPFKAPTWLFFVPGAGFEPALPFGKGGLSPPRLPIPPPGLGRRANGPTGVGGLTLVGVRSRA